MSRPCRAVPYLPFFPVMRPVLGQGSAPERMNPFPRCMKKAHRFCQAAKEIFACPDFGLALLGWCPLHTTLFVDYAAGKPRPHHPLLRPPHECRGRFRAMVCDGALSRLLLRNFLHFTAFVGTGGRCMYALRKRSTWQQTVGSKLFFLLVADCVWWTKVRQRPERKPY